MANERLYFFWMLMTGFFVFATVYSALIAITVRKSLPSEMAWTYFGLAFITGSNAFIRYGGYGIDPMHVVILQRAMWVMVAVTASISVVMLGIHYNGSFSAKISLRRQMRMLADSFQHNRQRPEADCE